jgi:hypothetical protein
MKARDADGERKTKETQTERCGRNRGDREPVGKTEEG